MHNLLNLPLLLATCQEQTQVHLPVISIHFLYNSFSLKAFKKRRTCEKMSCNLFMTGMSISPRFSD